MSVVTKIGNTQSIKKYSEIKKQSIYVYIYL